MGLFGNEWKDAFIPNCTISEDSSNGERAVITCNAKKILGDVVITGERPVKMVGEGGKLFILDDGGLPQNAIVLLQRYVKNNLRPQ